MVQVNIFQLQHSFRVLGIKRRKVTDEAAYFGQKLAEPTVFGIRLEAAYIA